jgi:hypothetical protein
MSDGLDIRHLLELIAHYDGRTIRLIDIELWATIATECGWNKRDAFDAVLDFFARDPQPVWTGDGPEAGQPRPVLPADITDHHDRVAQRGRDVVRA